MTKQIVWSIYAENDLGGILDYLDKKWNKKVSENFIIKTESLLNIISINPKQFPLIYPKLKIRKCVLTKHNTLYYKVNSKTIEILRIYDSRQNPVNLKFI